MRVYKGYSIFFQKYLKVSFLILILDITKKYFSQS